MQAKASDLCSSPIVNGPFPFSEIKDKPGVYRLYPGSSSSVMVAMKDGSYLYVKEDIVVGEFEKFMVPGRCKFWPTVCEVPDEIAT